ncbi:MAG: hypothetical protein ACOYT4_00085 [Nanoarchaeota archaeon]
MISYKELRMKLQNMPKLKGCVNIERSPIINEGFPGQFNLSFTELPLLKEYGRYTDFDHDYIFSTIMSCIRWNDIYDDKTKLSKLTGEKSWKYLGVFEMSDLVGLAHLVGRRNAVESQRKTVKAFFNLTDELGIKRKDIFPSYQKGGKICDITNCRYDFEFYVPEDKIGKQLLLDEGIPEKNFIEDKTTDTLLCLKLCRKLESAGILQISSPWGYRNEINVNIGTKENLRLVDIGTFESFLWKPVYKNEEIVNLADLNDATALGIVGLERLCMVANRLERICDLDFLKPFYDNLGKIKNSVLIGENLRALHRIYSDIKKYDIKDWNSDSRKKKINRLKRNVLSSEIGLEQIRDLLVINTEKQPWHFELKENIDFVLQEIKDYLGKLELKKYSTTQKNA